MQYVSGEKPEDRQKWRDQVLEANPKDFTNFAEKLKALSAPGGASVVVFGSQVHPQDSNVPRLSHPTNALITIVY